MIESVITILVTAVPAIVLHEVAHGWAACKLGDPTARDLGRLTLNPIKHIDLFGTIILPMLLYLPYVMHWSKIPFVFGYAKPVPFNPMRLGHPRRDIMLVRLAGPLTNILIALVCARLALMLGHGILVKPLVTAAMFNLSLAFFNLIPIPPLDGSGVWYAVLPGQWLRFVVKLDSMIGLVIVFVLLQVGCFDFMDGFILGALRLMGL